MHIDRRGWLRAGIGALALLAAPPGARATPARETIGVIGAGRVGGTMAALWVAAGYPVILASRHPQELGALAARLGPRAAVGTSLEAATRAQILFLAVPYGALPQLGSDLADAARGKVLLDACNPFPGRDGEIGERARREGAGETTAALFPGARVVRAFNSIGAGTVAQQAHRSGAKLAVPIAGDDRDAMATAERLVRDAGLEPVRIGGLAAGRLTQPGGPGWLLADTAEGLRRRLGLP